MARMVEITTLGPLLPIHPGILATFWPLDFSLATSSGMLFSRISYTCLQPSGLPQLPFRGWGLHTFLLNARPIHLLPILPLIHILREQCLPSGQECGPSPLPQGTSAQVYNPYLSSVLARPAFIHLST